MALVLVSSAPAWAVDAPFPCRRQAAVRWRFSMTLLKIYTGAAPVLRRRARPLRRVTAATRKLAEDMLETMRAAPGVGLAAPQAGIAERVIVLEYDAARHMRATPGA